MADDPNVANDGLNPTNADAEKKKDDIALKRWTMAGLSLAVIIGVIACWSHGGTETASIAAFGAALGLGGVLGFLFGIPSPGSKTSVNINQVNAAGVVEGGQGGGANAGHAGNPQLQGQNPGGGEGNGGGGAAKPPAATPPAPAAGQVSNLEQVADWVTKLLLGGGLTQMQHIPPKIWQWSHVVAIGILGKQLDSSGKPCNVSEQLIIAEQAFACGLMVYGFVLGFFAGFLITKLQLGKAIAE